MAESPAYEDVMTPFLDEFVKFFHGRKPDFDPGDETQVLDQFRAKMMSSFDPDVVKTYNFMDILHKANEDLKYDGETCYGLDLEEATENAYIKWIDAMREVLASCIRLQEDFADGQVVLLPLPDKYDWAKEAQLKHLLALRKKLQVGEVDFGNEEFSSFSRIHKVNKAIANLTAQMEYSRETTAEGEGNENFSCPEEIPNDLRPGIERMVNEEDETPNYRDILTLVKQFNPGMPKRDLSALAQDISVKVVESVHKWRGKNFLEDLQDIVRDTLDGKNDFRNELSRDPADTDAELAAKLEANRVVGTKRMAQAALKFEKAAKRIKLIPAKKVIPIEPQGNSSPDSHSMDKVNLGSPQMSLVDRSNRGQTAVVCKPCFVPIPRIDESGASTSKVRYNEGANEMELGDNGPSSSTRKDGKIEATNMDTFKLDKILSVRKGPQGKWVFEVTFQGLKGVNHVPFAVMKILYDKEWKSYLTTLVRANNPDVTEARITEILQLANVKYS